ncbi:MAG: DUF3307 domain-containing protein [Endomicrobiales bacterium]|nr:DUF3307 domain-containing protein [Endomicrobiales bacterium]
MQILWRLVLAHFLADFTLQTNFIADWKRRNVLGGFTHSFIFFVCGVALCFNYLGDTWLNIGNIVALNGWVSLSILTFLHFLEDEWRGWTIKKLNTPDNFFFFIWDQFIHLLLIFVFFPNQIGIYPEKWVLFAILFILATHFTSVFVYFLEKDLFGDSKVLVVEKYYSMAERLATAFCLLLPGAWGFSFLGVWLLMVFVYRYLRVKEYSLLNIVVGNLMAVLFGFAARVIYYKF